MRYHFLGSLIGRFFIYFFANCGFSLLLLQIGVLSLFFFLFARSRLFMMEGWMDGGWMHRWMGAIPVFYFGKRGGLLLFLHGKCGWIGIL